LFLVVLLVVLFGAVERSGRNDLGDDPTAEPLQRFEPGFGFLGFRLLLLVVIEDDGTVLGADVRALAVELRRVCDVQKTSSSCS
jgi:hypothetical protein